MKNVTDIKIKKAFANLRNNLHWQTILNDYIRKEYEDLKEALVNNQNAAIAGQAQALRTLIEASKEK